MTLFSKTMDSFKERSDREIIFVGGGIIPKKDIEALKAAGITGTFGPGTPINEIINFIKAELKKGSDDKED